MISILILKLDTPCTTVQSAMRVPQAEPINFAKAMIDAADEMHEVCTVNLLGTSTQEQTYGNNGTIRIVPYFGDDKTLKKYVDETTKVIIWQGMHIVATPTIENPAEDAAQLHLMDPYAADAYARLTMCKLWQVMMYNLISAPILADNDKYFLTTDARLPLLDLNKVNAALVPKPLPKGIVMLTQSHYAKEFMKWHNKFGNAQAYNECNIADYTYQFADAAYLPLHALPIWSHSQFYTEYHLKRNNCAIFQMQSLKYMDDFRKAQLQKAIDMVQGNCVLHGRFLAAERAIALSMLSKYTDDIDSCIIDNSSSAESFYDAAKTLSTYAASLIITDRRYKIFGLCPNRFVEALAVGTMPVGDASVVQNCDSVLQRLWQTYASDMPFDATVLTEYQFAPKSTNFKDACKVLRSQLINRLQIFADNALLKEDNIANLHDKSLLHSLS